MIWRESLRFSVTVDAVVMVGCKIVGVRLINLEVMVLELDSSFGFFLFGAGCEGMKFWSSG